MPASLSTHIPVAHLTLVAICEKNTMETTFKSYIRKKTSWILHKHKLKHYKRLFCNGHSTSTTGPIFSKNQFQLFLIYTNPNELLAKILNDLGHDSLASENFTAKIFSPSRSGFPVCWCEANSYYRLFKVSKMNNLHRKFSFSFQSLI